VSVRFENKMQEGVKPACLVLKLLNRRRGHHIHKIKWKKK